MSDYISDLSTLRSLNSSATNSTSSKSSKTNGSTSLDMTDFLSLMVAQFQNQDPENAASTTDMLNQMVQMSMVQAITNVTDAATMIYSSSLVGKQVTIGKTDDSGNIQETVGTVTGAGTYNSKPVVFVDGVRYDLSSIMAVGTLPASGDNSGK